MPRQRTVLTVLFAVMLFAGILSFRDYGISWDEPNMVRVGTEDYDAVFRGKPWPEGPGQRFYSPAFELALHAVQEATGVTDSRDIFNQRRILTFLFFILGTCFFFLLAKDHFQDWKLGALGAAMLFLSPRIFAHAFYNSRDIPALVMFIVCAYTLVRLLDERSLKWILLHGLATALLISVRITGVLMAGFTGLFLLWDLWREWRLERTLWKTTFLGGTYAIAAIILTILFWPFLWTDPVGHFLDAYRWSSQLSSGGFYLGTMMAAFPWHYVPVWIVASTPPLYTLAFLLGSASLAAWLIRGGFRNDPRSGRNWTLFGLWLVLPIALVVIMKKGLHGDYRHLYFVYPAFLLFSLEGIRALFATVRKIPSPRWMVHGQRALGGAIALSLLWTGIWMARNHPLQNLYFSLPARAIGGDFELDYWGLSFRKGFAYILANDDRPVILIHPTSSPGWSTPFVLPPEQRKRIQLVDTDEAADYVLDNFRDTNYKPSRPADREIHAVMVDGLKVLGVYKKK